MLSIDGRVHPFLRQKMCFEMKKNLVFFLDYSNTQKKTRAETKSCHDSFHVR